MIMELWTKIIEVNNMEDITSSLSNVSLVELSCFSSDEEMNKSAEEMNLLSEYFTPMVSLTKVDLRILEKELAEKEKKQITRVSVTSPTRSTSAQRITNQRPHVSNHISDSSQVI
jgi:hypothetical protein